MIQPRKNNNTRNMMTSRFIVDGCIACGKSTVLKEVELRVPSIVTAREPVEKWTHILDQFYKDPKKHAQQLNLTCMLDLAKRDSSYHNDCIVLSERSIHSSFHVFTKLAYRQDLLTSEEFDMIRDQYHTLCSRITSPSVFIFLDIDAKIAIERMKQRGRSEIYSSDTSYFVNLVNVYRDFYRKLSESGAIVYKVHAAQDADTVVSHVLDIINQVTSRF